MEIKKSGWRFTSTRRRGDASGVRFPRGKEENGATHVGVARASSLFAFFFPPPNSDRRRFRALRVRMIIEEQTKKNNRTLLRQPAIPVSEDDGSDASSPLQTTRPSASSVFLHNSIIRFFYVDASCSENMEFLKGPRTPPCTCQRSPAVAAAAAAASRSPRCG